ncbi:Translocator protein like [Rhynchospora pubera]|uniref:Translocator protein like n=1 Tax=Rhynchospora pubera TaxID=906938 RepID=A0AAV8DP46_9POAL|nr:Translocator protein like [Rhynchospora pubera]
MATSEGMKQRHVEKPTSADADATPPTNKDRKIAKAKRGLRTLAVALAIPVAFSAASACISGTTAPSQPDSKSSLQLPILAFHLGNIATAALTSLAAWLFWAKGGFHRRPTDLLFYLVQLLLLLMWGPAVFRLGNARLGVAVAVAMSVSLFGCARCFRRVNPSAGDIVVPCLAWALFLAMFSYKVM